MVNIRRQHSTNTLHQQLPFNNKLLIHHTDDQIDDDDDSR